MVKFFLIDETRTLTNVTIFTQNGVVKVEKRPGTAMWKQTND